MNHDHLLRILSWSVEPRKWVCCEFFDANLFKYIYHTRPWRVEAYLFTKLLSPIASAVAFLHSKNYVHKDINSHHVLFLEDFSRVVLSGHKLSKMLMDSSFFLSSAKRGECQWMDPECYKRKYCMESDIYSLGVVMGELLTGEQPYDGDSHGGGCGGYRERGEGWGKGGGGALFSSKQNTPHARGQERGGFFFSFLSFPLLCFRCFETETNTKHTVAQRS